MRSFLFLAAGAAILLSACHTHRKTAAGQHITLDTMRVSARNNPLDIYRATAPRIWDILHTRAALSFNYEARTADGRAWLDLKPYAADTAEVTLDAKGMRIDSVARLIGPRLVSLPFKYADDQLRIQLPAINTGIVRDTDEVLHLYIRYTAMPYADSLAGGSAAITEDRGLYFINTDRALPGKPVQIWTQGETESNSHWLPTIDKPNERFTTRLELTVPDTFVTLSNGALVQSRRSGTGLRTDIWETDQPIQAYAVMFAIGKFAIVKDSWRGKEVSYYVEPEYAPHARAMFQHTPQMIEHFSQITGVPYPWNKYSQVVVRDYVSGAMENTSASLFGEFVNQTAREIPDVNYEDVVSHELFHQWFGDYVTAESWSNLTVNESFANYGEQLWRRHYYGPARADELAFDDLNKYLSQTEQKDPPLVRFHYADKEDMFDRISYEKGGAILRYINGLTGDALFHKAMNSYLTRNALRPAEATHWRLALEEATGKDWNPFFNQFYYRGGHPQLSVRYDYDDAAKQLKVTVRQQSRPDTTYRYQLPLKALVIGSNGQQVVDWNIAQRTETFVYPYQNGVRPVVVPDYYHWLPGELIDYKSPAQWLTQFRQTGDHISKRLALNGVFVKPADSASLAAFTYALTDTMPSIRAHALRLLARIDRQSYKDALTRQVSYLATQDGANRVRAAAFTVLGAWKVASARADMEAAITDSSYAIAGAALVALGRIDSTAGYQRARQLVSTNPRLQLEGAVWNAIAEKGAAEDFHVFEEKADRVYGSRKLTYAGYLADYMAHVKDSAVFYKGLDIIGRLYRSENITSYRKAVIGQSLGIGAALKAQQKKAKEASSSAAIGRRMDAVKQRLLELSAGLPDRKVWEGYIRESFGG